MKSIKFLSFILVFQLAFCLSVYSQLHIILMGPPGAGKGTLAQNLCKTGNYSHICIGDLLRAEVRKNTELGSSIKSLIDRGQLIDVKITAELVKQKVEEILKESKSFILDGFPRSFACLPELYAIIERYNLAPEILCVCLEAQDVCCLERIGGRLVCCNCDSVFNNKEHNLMENDRCPECHDASLTRRANDRYEVAQERIWSFRKDIDPVIEEMKLRYNSISIDTHKPIEACFDECLENLKNN